MEASHQILLYYKYVWIEDPQALMRAQTDLCKLLRLKGRIIVAHEGINGTVEGLTENTARYIETMRTDPRFKDIHFKKSEGTGAAFPRLSVKVRSEIVTGSLKNLDVNPNEVTGTYLTAEQLHAWIHGSADGKAGRKEFFIVDMRNDYEYKVGRFEGSLNPKLDNFRDLQAALPKLEHLRDKTVVTVCTGGVRCEKASGFLVKNGFKEVYQLFGGIVTYMEKYPQEDFKGSLYVFDGRIVMSFNSPTIPHEVVSQCEKCASPSEHYVNCTNNFCHKHFICCEACVDKTEKRPFCSAACREKVASLISTASRA